MTAINEADLIISKQGRIYHLDLAPGEIAETIITVGDPGRVATVSKYFDKIDLKRVHREFVTHTGELNGKRLSVISTGIGTGNLDIVINELDALVNIDFTTREVKKALTVLSLIRVGTAGGLQTDIPLDSVVTTSYAIGLGVLMSYYRLDYSPDEQAVATAITRSLGDYANLIHPYAARGDADLLALFSDCSIAGMTVTSPGFFGTQGRQVRAQLRMPDLLDRLVAFSCPQGRVVNFEMETAALYGLARLLGHRACSLSAIIADRSSGRFSPDFEKTVDALVRRTLEKIC